MTSSRPPTLEEKVEALCELELARRSSRQTSYICDCTSGGIGCIAHATHHSKQRGIFACEWHATQSHAWSGEFWGWELRKEIDASWARRINWALGLEPKE